MGLPIIVLAFVWIHELVFDCWDMRNFRQFDYALWCYLASAYVFHLWSEIVSSSQRTLLYNTIYIKHNIYLLNIAVNRWVRAIRIRNSFQLQSHSELSKCAQKPRVTPLSNSAVNTIGLYITENKCFERNATKVSWCNCCGWASSHGIHWDKYFSK